MKTDLHNLLKAHKRYVSTSSRIDYEKYILKNTPHPGDLKRCSRELKVFIGVKKRFNKSLKEIV